MTSAFLAQSLRCSSVWNHRFHSGWGLFTDSIEFQHADTKDWVSSQQMLICMVAPEIRSNIWGIQGVVNGGMEPLYGKLGNNPLGPKPKI